MSRKYKIRDQTKLYFVTLTVVNWIDVFTRQSYRDVCIKSVKYCQENKGLEVYAYCMMTNHIHLIIGSNGTMNIEDILRDLKSFTSRSIRKLLEDRNNIESRRDWMLVMMKQAGQKNSNNKDFQFWRQHNHPIELSSNQLMDQKLNYIHMNPVKAGFVESPEMWTYSSAKDYWGTGKSEIAIVIIE
ncbi:transposase [Catalinimonas sp. 4WD22]|uniref:REP-associated tyrosine transposase n=1 Tax=Catalinimonas locisalis TaxID=3133978 RepID=UPI0031011809